MPNTIIFTTRHRTTLQSKPSNLIQAQIMQVLFTKLGSSSFYCFSIHNSLCEDIIKLNSFLMTAPVRGFSVPIYKQIIRVKNHNW